ncbi:MAG: hypothetical protein ABFC24_07750 [Methanoregulaceae archaeon]
MNPGTDGMPRTGNRKLACELMQDFAQETGLEPASDHPHRYLWTDAFAVCTYLGLFRGTGRTDYRELALRLVNQVHHTLGRHRDDDLRAGWISGLSSEEGEQHPTAGGLRIGKPLPERSAAEPYNEQQEWDRDGQYFHYLTKWMHALHIAGSVTGNPVFGRWAIELARTAHSRFTYLPPHSARKRMYWKMSIDLTRPLVPSLGQHDPLDGLITYRELQLAAESDSGYMQPVLVQEIEEMAEINRDLPLETPDPLGIGGLLSDASRIARLAGPDGPVGPDLLERVMDAALSGLESFPGTGSLDHPARYRLAFRELGLSIGLAGTRRLPSVILNNPHLSGRAGSLISCAEALREYFPMKDTIETFWTARENRMSVTWMEHRDISMVMLATSLVPEGFLGQ